MKSRVQREQNLAYYHRHRERNLAWQRAYRQRLKDEVYAAYGGYVCACCGETQKIFLTLDHIKNDGTAHRKQMGSRGGIAIYVWLRKHKFPPGIQVLCFNCNHGKQLNHGVCPHKAEDIS